MDRISSSIFLCCLSEFVQDVVQGEFILRSRGAWALNLTLCILVLAIFCRLMMERTRRLAADAENDQLKDDLRRLTQLYAEEKKKNNA